MVVTLGPCFLQRLHKIYLLILESRGGARGAEPGGFCSRVFVPGLVRPTVNRCVLIWTKKNHKTVITLDNGLIDISC